MTLHFLEYGSGHPLIILHGLLGSLDNWHTQSKSLGTRYRVFAVDQRNHGRSPHSDIFNYEAMAEDLEEFLVRHQLASTSILGHSMGGKTAMLFALSHPDRVDKLVAVDIAPRAYPALHDEILRALLSLNLSRYASRQEVDAALALDIPDFAVRQFLLKNLRQTPNGTFRWKMNLNAIQTHYAEISKAIESKQPFVKPALFVRSTRSGYVRDSDIADITRLFPLAQISEVDAGHWIHADAPAEFSRVVLSFLTLPRSSP